MYKFVINRDVLSPTLKKKMTEYLDESSRMGDLISFFQYCIDENHA